MFVASQTACCGNIPKPLRQRFHLWMRTVAKPFCIFSKQVLTDYFSSGIIKLEFSEQNNEGRLEYARGVW